MCSKRMTRSNNSNLKGSNLTSLSSTYCCLKRMMMRTGSKRNCSTRTIDLKTKRKMMNSCSKNSKNCWWMTMRMNCW